MGDRYAIHGMVVDSELRISACAAPTGVPAGLTVVWGHPEKVSARPPPGNIVAALDACRYSVVRTARGLHFWFAELAEAKLDERSNTLVVNRHPEAEKGLVELLLGSMLAIVLSLRHASLLHASSVAIGNRALAIVGDEGSGKSTVAALLVRGGAKLVTDDVLRIEIQERGVRWHRGTTELRLRPHAKEAAGLGAALELTPDERWAMRAGTTKAAAGSLIAVVLPRPSRVASSVRLERLTQPQSLLELAFAPRLRGLREPSALRNQFRDLANLARSVPVLRAELPWGPPFYDTHTDDLRTSLSTMGIEWG